MWQYHRVERALFRWNKWRNSIINRWITWDDQIIEKENIQKLEVSEALLEMKLPDLPILKIYWTACVTSEYNLDYPETFCNIKAPVGYRCTKFEILPGMRVYPPQIVTEEDLKFEARQRGLIFEWIKQFCSKESSLDLLLQPDHDLFSILQQMRGRPATHGKRGPAPRYNDRLAVQCASLRKNGLSYIRIANKLGLRVTRPWSSNQSDVALHLVKRGNTILRELS